ncbi:hypothetical protein OG211_15645 [Streptomyces niveus]|uniref:hypothetical protein n=1 Tax=Streptomyces niveus TaxID=193462 RepID=UPI003723A15D|nr:hypothetical protein OG211_15645 [Streptomyces niveus]
MIDETPPHVGALVLDTAAGRLAEYRGPVGGLRLLRAYLGAYEWKARPEDLRRTESVHVPGGADTPVTHTECEECDAWWWAEQLALDEAELSEAVDCRVYLRRHRHVAHADRPPACGSPTSADSGLSP